MNGIAKAGDRVRMTTDDPCGGFKKGDVFTAKEGGFVDNDGDRRPLAGEAHLQYEIVEVDDETPTPSDADQFIASLTPEQRELLKQAL